MKIIRSPNPKYTGVSASVAFKDGVGKTADPNLIAWFQEHGYTVVEPAPEPETSVIDTPPDPEPGESVAPKPEKPKRTRKGEAK